MLIGGVLLAVAGYLVYKTVYKGSANAAPLSGKRKTVYDNYKDRPDYQDMVMKMTDAEVDIAYLLATEIWPNNVDPYIYYLSNDNKTREGSAGVAWERIVQKYGLQ